MKTYHILSFLLVTLFMLSCGVVEKLSNRDPVIKNISASKSVMMTGDTVTVSVTAEDPDEDELTYSWACLDGSGSFANHTSAKTVWTAPAQEDDYTLEVTVRDKNEGEAKESLLIKVLSNSAPNVAITSPQNGDFLVPTGSFTVKAEATPVAYINKLEFYIDDQLMATDTTPPFSFDWDMQGYSGYVVIKARAYRDVPGPSWSDAMITVSIQGVVPIP